MTDARGRERSRRSQESGVGSQESGVRSQESGVRRSNLWSGVAALQLGHTGRLGEGILSDGERVQNHLGYVDQFDQLLLLLDQLCHAHLQLVHRLLVNLGSRLDPEYPHILSHLSSLLELGQVAVKVARGGPGSHQDQVIYHNHHRIRIGTRTSARNKRFGETFSPQVPSFPRLSSVQR